MGILGDYRYGTTSVYLSNMVNSVLPLASGEILLLSWRSDGRQAGSAAYSERGSLADHDVDFMAARVTQLLPGEIQFRLKYR